MAKESPKPKTETPFQKFERMARKLVAVPKREADKVKQQRVRKSSARPAR
jgi:hypothetical protein